MEPKTVVPARRATEDEWRRLPPELHAEFWDGEIVAVAQAPSVAHQYAVGALGDELRGPFVRGRGGPGGWWILADVDVRVARRLIIRPDLVGWRRERLPSLPREGTVDLVPDWVCEVLSRSTARHDRGRKLPACARAGVAHAWLVDLEHRLVEVHVRSGRRYVSGGVFGDGDLCEIPPFAGCSIAVSSLFVAPPLAHEPAMPRYVAAPQPRSATRRKGVR